MHQLQVGEHIQCLDVLKVAFPSGNGTASHDCAILLEIWDQGGVLQTSVPSPRVPLSRSILSGTASRPRSFPASRIAMVLYCRSRCVNRDGFRKGITHHISCGRIRLLELEVTGV